MDQKKAAFKPLSPHLPGGYVTPEQLRQLAQIAESVQGTLKITGNTISVSPIPVEQHQLLLDRLGTQPESFMAKAVRGVTMCTGKPNCRMAKQDSNQLGLTLDARFFGRPLPGKIRIGVSGCPNSCSEVVTKDIGLMGLPNGYTLLVGGNAGRRPQLGQKVAENIPEEKVPDLVDKILNFYEAEGQPGERFNQTLNRVGLDQLIEKVIPKQYT